MNTVREYVDGLFAKYPAGAVADFTEEICVNLQERINYLVKNGMEENAAFAKATAELGDVSAIAEQISFDKHQEVFAAMYMKSRNYLDKTHIIGYVLAGGLLAFGVIKTLLGYWISGLPVAGFGAMLPLFFILPICAFVFLGLTQETAKNYPMSWKRSLLYTLAVALILFGLTSMALDYLYTRLNYTAVTMLLPFALPGALGLALLILTEKSRAKPWFAEQQAAWVQRVNEQFADPRLATRFGLYSGALWILALALFLMLGFIVGFQYSWLIFLFAVAGQVFLQAQMIAKGK